MHRSCFLERFFPDYYIESIFTLPVDELKKKGIKVLIFDIDNTIAPFDHRVPDKKTISFFSQLRKQGFKLCILSNNKKVRIHIFNEPLHVHAVHRAGKPGTRKLRAAVKKIGASLFETAIIGDQVFTDVWCANRAGAVSILTAPMCKRDQLVTKVKRGLEAKILHFYFKKEGITPFQPKN